MQDIVASLVYQQVVQYDNESLGINSNLHPSDWDTQSLKQKKLYFWLKSLTCLNIKSMWLCFLGLCFQNEQVRMTKAVTGGVL